MRDSPTAGESDSPSRGIDSPSRGIDSPSRGIDSPSRGIDSPLEEATPRACVTTPP